MKVQEISITDLVVHGDNVRTKPGDVSDLVASIRSIGLLQPLSVIKNGTGYKIVAGQRRFTALKELKAKSVPCVVLDGDTANVTAISLAENFARVPLGVMDACEAFEDMRKKGGEVKAIAETFGVTEHFVAQRLALGTLDKDVRAFVRENPGMFYMDTLEALTTTDKAFQVRWLKEAKKKNPDLWVNHGRQIRRMTHEKAIESSFAVFPLADYLVAGGKTSTDLFKNVTYLLDGKLVIKLQQAAIDAEVARLKAAGWANVAFIEHPNYETKHSEKSKDKAKAIVTLTIERKSVEVTDANEDDEEIYTSKLVAYFTAPAKAIPQRVKEQKKAAKVAKATASGDPTGELSQAVTRTILDKKVAVAQAIATTLDHDAVVALACAMLMTTYHNNTGGGLTTNGHHFAAEEAKNNCILAARASSPVPLFELSTSSFPKNIEVLRGLDADKRQALFRALVGRAVGEDHMAWIASLTTTNTRVHWTPDPDLLGRLSKDALKQILMDIGEPTVAATIAGMKKSQAALAVHRLLETHKDKCPKLLALPTYVAPVAKPADKPKKGHPVQRK